MRSFQWESSQQQTYFKPEWCLSSCQCPRTDPSLTSTTSFTERARHLMIDEHLEILAEIFRLLRLSGMQVNLDKSELCQKQVRFLHFLLTRTGYIPTCKELTPSSDWHPQRMQNKSAATRHYQFHQESHPKSSSYHAAYHRPHKEGGEV